MTPAGFPILPHHLLARYPDFNHLDYNAKPIGSGPYEVVRWNHGSQVDLVPNAYYYRGAPKIAHLMIRFVPDGTVAMNQLQTGEADGIFNDPNYGDYPLLRKIKGMSATATRIDGVGPVIYNTQDPITRDVRVRQALSYAIDARAVVAKAYRGALDSHDAGRGLFIWAYDPRAYGDLPYDPELAARLLSAAGWMRGPDGARRKDGRPLQLLMVLQSSAPYELVAAEEIAAYERAVGAVVTLKQYDVKLFASPVTLGGPVYGGKFQLALYPFLPGDDPDSTDQFACSNIPPNGYNKSRICDPRIDGLLAAGRATFDIAKRRAIYAELQHILREEMPLALLYQQREINVFTTRLHGQSTSLSGAFWNVGAWTLAR
jgi:peptide/nickel transport system substrate-binding protein